MNRALGRSAGKTYTRRLTSTHCAMTTAAALVNAGVATTSVLGYATPLSAFEPQFAPCRAKCSRSSTSPDRSIRCASTAAGSSPAFGTILVSSKLTDTRLSSWFARTQQVPFHLATPGLERVDGPDEESRR